jgi:GTP-binding protein
MTDKTAINFNLTTFVHSAATYSQCLEDTGFEVAFAGRSNAGKSSVINTLTQQKKLARISKTPGRTQLLNFFSINDEQRLVDLPGYGYAKVPLALREKWGKELSLYFQRRQSLRGLIIIMDIRHPLQEHDMIMLKYAIDRKLNCHVLLNKSDKLKYGQAKNQLFQVSDQLKEIHPHCSVQLFSSLKRSGTSTLKEIITEWLNPTP